MANQLITAILLPPGLAASRPAAASTPIGALYYSTDTKIMERNNGVSWDIYSAPSIVFVGDPTRFLDGTGAFDVVRDSDLSLSNITTNDVSITKHGFAPTLPNDATKFLNGTGGYTAPASSASDIYANRPAAGVNGRLYFPTNGFEIDRDNGSTWSPFGPIYPQTAPDDSTFSWVNQGGATTDTTHGGVILSCPKNATDSWRLRVKALPSVPYTLTAALTRMGFLSNFQGMGIVLRASGAGTFIVLGITTGGSLQLKVDKWNSATSFNSSFLSQNIANFPNFFRIQDDNTNWLFSVSMDGQSFTQVFSTARNTFATADQIGWGGDELTNLYVLNVTLSSFLVTNP